MTNREELSKLNNLELAKRLVLVKFDGRKLRYHCPDGSVFDSTEAIEYTAEWLDREVVEEA